jgi:hypothetical protein
LVAAGSSRADPPEAPGFAADNESSSNGGLTTPVNGGSFATLRCGNAIAVSGSNGLSIRGVVIQCSSEAVEHFLAHRTHVLSSSRLRSVVDPSHFPTWTSCPLRQKGMLL